MKYPLINPKKYWQLTKDLFSFIKQPNHAENKSKSTKEKVYDTIGLFFIKITFSICVAIILGAFYEPKNMTTASLSERFSPLMFLAVGGIILPFFEEICFRLSLKFKPIYLGATGAAFSYFLLTKFYQTKLSLVDESFFTRIIISIFIGLICFLIANPKNIKDLLEKFWVNNFRWIYYLSCITFAWLHIFNFELIMLNLLLLPILTLPQLFSATIAGYTRTAFGFRYPLIVHMCTNLLFISLSFLPFD